MADKIDKRAFESMITSAEADNTLIDFTEKKEGEAKGMSVSDMAHAGLAAAGMVPVVGNIADVADAGLYALEGDKVGAGLSLAAAVPGAGLGAGAVKLGKVGKNLKSGVRAADEVAEHGVVIPRRPRSQAAMEADRVPSTLRTPGTDGMHSVRRTESVIEDLGSRSSELYEKLTGSTLDMVDYQNYLDELMTIDPALARKVINELGM